MAQLPDVHTAIVLVLIGLALVAIARVNDIPPSKLLLPVGLGTIIAGMATTIGTSTNLLVVTLARTSRISAFRCSTFPGTC